MNSFKYPNEKKRESTKQPSEIPSFRIKALLTHFELLRLYCKNIRLDLDQVVTSLNIFHEVHFAQKEIFEFDQNTDLRECKLLLLLEYCLKGLTN